MIQEFGVEGFGVEGVEGVEGLRLEHLLVD